MKKIVWTFGLISGAICTFWLILFVFLYKNFKGAESGEVLGYTAMILSFSLIFFGVRTYRDRHLDGMISFGKAFKIGLFITLIASSMYVLVWEIEYHFFIPEFIEDYSKQQLEKLQASGKSAEEIAKAAQDMEKFKKLYDNIFFNIGMTFLEIFPVGLLISLICAGILKRNKPRNPQLAIN